MRAVPLFLLRGVAILAGVTRLCFCWRAATGPESPQAEQLRTAAFVLAFVAASFAWPTRPPRPGGRNKERL
jgi:hypothetical protein